VFGFFDFLNKAKANGESKTFPPIVDPFSKKSGKAAKKKKLENCETYSQTG